MIEWTGVLAVLDTPSADGCVFQTPERLLSRPLPLPLTLVGGQPVGAITTLAIHGDQLRMEGTIRDGILTPDRPLAVCVDAEDTEVHTGNGALIYSAWRVMGATLLLDLEDEPPWPKALIRVKGGQP